jgi:hypothetical protein
LAQLSKRGVLFAVLAGALAVAFFSLRLLGPSSAPTGQRPLETLTSASVGSLTQRFDAAADSTRLLVLLSPT